MNAVREYFVLSKCYKARPDIIIAHWIHECWNKKLTDVEKNSIIGHQIKKGEQNDIRGVLDGNFNSRFIVEEK